MRFLPSLAALPLLVAAGPSSSFPSVAERPDGAVRLHGLAVDPDTVPIKEWTVPWERSRPRDPYFDKRTGNVFFVGQVGNYIGRLDPRTGEFKRFELEERALPHNVVVDEDGSLWYAGNGNGHIGKMDPSTGRVTRYAMPDTSVRDPHTLTFGTDGDLWFTAQRAGYVGRLHKATGEVKLVRVGTGRSLPYGIEVDTKGRAWVNEFGTNKIAMIEPGTLKVTEFTLPDSAARSRRIAVTPDDQVWYVDYARGYLGHLDPASGRVSEWPLPGGPQSRPYAMTHDDRGRLWLVETGVSPNRLVGFDPTAKEFFSITPIRSAVNDAGRNTVRHMMYNPATREIWFGTDANTIGRATLPAR
jgi:virginiamycin B lyase